MEWKKLRAEEMTTEQKLGMLLCHRRCFSSEDLAYTLEMIKKRAVGCVQVSVSDKAPEIIRTIREAADYPVLIFADMEQGYQRSDLPTLPAMTLAACPDPEYRRAFARGIVANAKAEGYSGTWGPVIDILRCDGPCRISRVFGDTPEKVAEAAGDIAGVFREYGFISTGKHYPGGSDNDIDTHMAEGFSHVTEQDLIDFDIAPYVSLMKRGLLPCVMTHHCTYSAVDPDLPATLSPKVLGLLRKQGFDGVFFTDSLAMMGILQKYGEENVMGMAVAAGVDIVLPNYRTPVKECYRMLEQNYRDGAFDEERLNDAVRHVLELQSFLADNFDKQATVTERDRELLNNAARDCVTAITDEGVSAALGDVNKKRLFVVVTEQNFNADTPAAEIANGQWYFPREIADEIRAQFPNAEVVFLPEFSTAHENERVLNSATRHDEVVLVTFCSTACYLGTDSLTKRTEAVANCLILSGKVSAVVHFGNPYALKPLYHVPRKIFGYTAPASQKPAIQVLSGKLPALGKLPFDIQFR